MNIGFATPAYYPAQIGASFYSQELAEGLTKKGHNVKVVVPLPQREEGFVKERETRNNVEIVRVPIGANWERFRRLTGISYYISKKMTDELKNSNFGIIHSHHYGYYPATAGLEAAKQKGIPHVFGPYYHPPIYGFERNMLASIYHKKFGKKLLQESDVVLPHTEHEKNLLLKIGAREENTQILPNIVDTRKFSIGHKKENIVLFVGNFLKEKGADVAMELAKKLIEKRRDVRFVFVGNIFSDHPHRKSMEEMKTKLASTGRAMFTNNLSKNDLVKAYQKASILLLPSKYEAFSRVIAEAQSCGCAVVSTKVGAIPEVVIDGKTGFLADYGNWTAMEEKVEYLLDNRNEAKKMGINGSRLVRKNFDKDIIVKKLNSIYNDLV